MKAVILAGGLGTRLSEETATRPKPMVTIGGKPILWHLLKLYSAHGINEFVICCGYKGYLIKEFFANYFLHMSDVTFDIANNSMTVHKEFAEAWRVTLIDTGENTQTGGRLKRVEPYIKNDEAFCFTYGDGLADVDVNALIEFHRSHGGKATITAVRPPGRFGALELREHHVTRFLEKPTGDGNYINGGFFVLSPSCLDLIEDDNVAWEGKPMRTLTEQGEVYAFHHNGYWQPMDTIREKELLESLWSQGSAPWKVWPD